MRSHKLQQAVLILWESQGKTLQYRSLIVRVGDYSALVWDSSMIPAVPPRSDWRVRFAVS